MWDIKPQGYENVTAEQAKLSGRLFPFWYFLITPHLAQALAYTSRGVSISAPAGGILTVLGIVPRSASCPLRISLP